MKTISIPEKPHSAVIHNMCMRTRHDYGSDDVSQEHREHLYKEMEGLYKEIVDFYRDRNVSNSFSPLPWLTRLFSTPRLRKNSG